MAQTERTLEQMNAAQLRTIQELTQRVKELEQWEKFAGYLVNNCLGQAVTQENLEMWAVEAQKPKRL